MFLYRKEAGKDVLFRYSKPAAARSAGGVAHAAESAAPRGDTGDRRADQSLWEAGGGERAEPGSAARRGVWLSGSQWRGQDNYHSYAAQPHRTDQRRGADLWSAAGNESRQIVALCRRVDRTTLVPIIFERAR